MTLYPVGIHLFGILIWFGSMMTALHLLLGWERLGRPGDFKKLSGNIGRIMDMGASLVLITGILMLTNDAGRPLLKHGFMHAKLTAVVVLLGLHGLVRATLGKVSRGEARAIPVWVQPVVIGLYIAILFLIVKRPF